MSKYKMSKKEMKKYKKAMDNFNCANDDWDCSEYFEDNKKKKKNKKHKDDREYGYEEKQVSPEIMARAARIRKEHEVFVMKSGINVSLEEYAKAVISHKTMEEAIASILENHQDVYYEVPKYQAAPKMPIEEDDIEMLRNKQRMAEVEEKTGLSLLDEEEEVPTPDPVVVSRPVVPTMETEDSYDEEVNEEFEEDDIRKPILMDTTATRFDYNPLSDIFKLQASGQSYNINMLKMICLAKGNKFAFECFDDNDDLFQATVDIMINGILTSMIPSAIISKNSLDVVLNNINLDTNKFLMKSLSDTSIAVYITDKAEFVNAFGEIIDKHDLSRLEIVHLLYLLLNGVQNAVDSFDPTNNQDINMYHNMKWGVALDELLYRMEYFALEDETEVFMFHERLAKIMTYKLGMLFSAMNNNQEDAEDTFLSDYDEIVDENFHSTSDVEEDDSEDEDDCMTESMDDNEELEEEVPTVDAEQLAREREYAEKEAARIKAEKKAKKKAKKAAKKESAKLKAQEEAINTAHSTDEEETDDLTEELLDEEFEEVETEEDSDDVEEETVEEVEDEEVAARRAMIEERRNRMQARVEEERNTSDEDARLETKTDFRKALATSGNEPSPVVGIDTSKFGEVDSVPVEQSTAPTGPIKMERLPGETSMDYVKRIKAEAAAKAEELRKQRSGDN